MEDLSDDTRRQEALTGIVTEIRAVMRVFAEEQRLPSQDLPYENINFNNG